MTKAEACAFLGWLLRSHVCLMVVRDTTLGAELIGGVLKDWPLPLGSVLRQVNNKAANAQVIHPTTPPFPVEIDLHSELRTPLAFPALGIPGPAMSRLRFVGCLGFVQHGAQAPVHH